MTAARLTVALGLAQTIAWGSSYYLPAVLAGAMADDLGLPPAWVGVGTFDVFHDEDVDYAERLRAAGVPCELEVVPGAYHGFDGVAANTQVARAFFASQVDFLRPMLNPAVVG